MTPTVTITALRSALTTIVQLVWGQARPAIDVSVLTRAGDLIYTAVVPTQYRSHVYRFLAQHPRFRLLHDEIDSLTLTSEQAADIIWLSYEYAQRAAALE